jgi:hypothetical protein
MRNIGGPSNRAARRGGFSRRRFPSSLPLLHPTYPLCSSCRPQSPSPHQGEIRGGFEGDWREIWGRFLIHAKYTNQSNTIIYVPSHCSREFFLSHPIVPIPTPSSLPPFASPHPPASQKKQNKPNSNPLNSTTALPIANYKIRPPLKASFLHPKQGDKAGSRQDQSRFKAGSKPDSLSSPQSQFASIEP